MKQSLQKKLETLVERHEELAALLSAPEVINQQDRYREFSREYAVLEPWAAAFSRYQQCLQDYAEAQAMLKDADPDLQEMAKQESEQAQIEITELEKNSAGVVVATRSAG